MTTRIHHVFVATIAALVLALPVAWAGTPSTGKSAAKTTAKSTTAKATAAKTTKPKVKTLIFGEGSDLEGGVVGPDGETIGGRIDLLHSNLIRVRTDFLAEIHKSAEDL